ncbi:MAG: AraC family transcriptional regulator [Desulfobacteraceae bacterium]|nr:AraC family transcriptional regulator [Desulfobacteraceae bacterium]
MPNDLLSRQRLALNIEEYFLMWQALEKIIDTPCGALILGKDVPFEFFTPPMIAAFYSPNLNVCMERLNQYKKLTGPSSLNIYENEDKTIVELECLHTKTPLPSFLVVTNFVFFVDLIRRATKKEIKPILVETQIPLKGKAYIDFFGVIPKKGEINRIAFSKTDAQHPFLTENAPMLQFFKSDLQQRLAELSRDESYTTRVHRALLELLPTRKIFITNVADKLGISKRSLQRYLSKESTNFQIELNQIREGLARHYLINMNMSSSEISFLIGFDDPGSFIRAFRLWTGKTPQELRQENK